MQIREARLIALKIAVETLKIARDELYAVYGGDTEMVKEELGDICNELAVRRARLQRSLKKEETKK